MLTEELNWKSSVVWILQVRVVKLDGMAKAPSTLRKQMIAKTAIVNH
jgi:hypothetical protein